MMIKKILRCLNINNDSGVNQHLIRAARRQLNVELKPFIRQNLKVNNEEIALVNSGNKIQAIKKFRQRNPSVSLLEAKHAVEEAAGHQYENTLYRQ